MKRDKDLIREILLETETTPAMESLVERINLYGHSDKEARYHIRILQMGGFIVHSDIVMTFELTRKGNELLDDIRDPEIWRKIKARVKDIAGASIGLLWDLAKAEKRGPVRSYSTT